MTSKQSSRNRKVGVVRRAASAAITLPMLLIVLSGFTLGGCQPPPIGDDPVPADAASDLNDSDKPITWSPAFDTTGVGALSAVWGSSPNNVFIVGGTSAGGEIYRYDGTTWRQMTVPDVPLLVWVFGFAADNVYAVGLDGGALHFNGEVWTTIDTGTDEDLWGIWGRSPDDFWIVGGDVGQSDPVLIRSDGQSFTSVPVPPNDRDAAALFKIWGTKTKLFAVGENGLIIEYDGTRWSQVPAGADADEDFVALWGADDANIVAVGGRTGARIAVYDGQVWTTRKLAGVPGLSGVFMSGPTECIVGGVSGYVGNFNPETDQLADETADAQLDLHAVWGDGQGRYYAVGGRFRPPYEGIALVRTVGDAPLAPARLISAPVLELGTGGDTRAYEELLDDAPWTSYVGFQGFVEAEISLRATGFDPNADVELNFRLTWAADGRLIHKLTRKVALTETETGTNELLEWRAILTRPLCELCNQDVILEIEITDAADPTISASLTRNLMLMLIDTRLDPFDCETDCP